jgi:hypothetical protein
MVYAPNGDQDLWMAGFSTTHPHKSSKFGAVSYTLPRHSYRLTYVYGGACQGVPAKYDKSTITMMEWIAARYGFQELLQQFRRFFGSLASK